MNARRFHAVTRGTWAGAVVLALVGCGKKDATAPAVVPPKAAAVAAAASVAKTGGDRIQLAKAAAAVRCQLTGYAQVNPKVYADFGFASAADYAAHWQAAAQADPAWARLTLASLYTTACPGQRPLAAATAPTPTAVAPQAAP